jgi:opacity protein-like surface antigen
MKTKLRISPYTLIMVLGLSLSSADFALASTVQKHSKKTHHKTIHHHHKKIFHKVPTKTGKLHHAPQKSLAHKVDAVKRGVAFEQHHPKQIKLSKLSSHKHSVKPRKSTHKHHYTKSIQQHTMRPVSGKKLAAKRHRSNVVQLSQLSKPSHTKLPVATQAFAAKPYHSVPVFSQLDSTTLKQQSTFMTDGLPFIHVKTQPARPASHSKTHPVPAKTESARADDYQAHAKTHPAPADTYQAHAKAYPAKKRHAQKRHAPKQQSVSSIWVTRTRVFLPDVFDLSLGPAWSQAGATQTIQLTPSVEKMYVAIKSAQTAGYGALFFGFAGQINEQLQSQIGLELAGITNVKLQGDIWDESDPYLNNSSYNYKVNSARVALKGKILDDIGYTIVPYVSASVGLGFNRASGYTLTLTDCSSVSTPLFGSNMRTAFSYSVGVGAQKALSNQVQVGLGYNFTDWGANNLSPASGQTSSSGLTLSHLYTNALLFNLSYLA